MRAAWRSPFCVVLFLLVYASASQADTVNNFNDPGTPYTLTKHDSGSAPVVTGGVVRLVLSGQEYQQNSIVFDRADTGPFQIVTAEFDFRLYEGTSTWADGFGLVLLPTGLYGTTGSVAAMATTAEEPNITGALGIGFDIFDNLGIEISGNHASLHWDGSRLGEIDLGPLDLEGTTWVHVTVTVAKAYGGSNVTVTLTKGATTVTPFDEYFVAGLAPYEYRVGLAARTGTSTITAEHDNVLVQNSLLGPLPPVAADDMYLVDKDDTLVVTAPGVLENDYDMNGDPLTAIQVTGPSHGALTLNADGSFTYTPDTGFTGEDNFTYKANDGGSDSNTATVRINVGDIFTGLVAHWKFDDGSGTTVVDSSGNDYHGTRVGNPSWTTGIRGGALSFPGTIDDYVTAPHGAADGLSDFSVSFWLKTSKTGQQGVLSGANAGVDNEFLVYLENSTQIRLHLHDSEVSWSINALADDRWHHVAVTRETAAVEATYYIDGVSQGSKSITSVITAIDPDGLVIGEEQDSVGGGFNPAQALEGCLDDLRIYDRALSPEEIAVLAAAEPIALDDAYSIFGGQTLTVAAPGVLENDYDPNDDPISAVLVETTSNGQLWLYPDGSFAYIPNAGFVGFDTFTYQATNGLGETSETVTVTITVESIKVTALTPAHNEILTAGPGSIVATFNTAVGPATVNTTTFLLVRSGGDGIFDNGNDVSITPAGVAATSVTEATMDLTGVVLPEDTYQVTLVGTGGAPITDLLGNILDGEFTGTFPSGDGLAGGDFVSRFRVMAPLFTDVTVAQFPSVRSALGNAFFDIDGDGDLDLVDASQVDPGGLGNFVYLNDGSGTFALAPGNGGLPTDTEGHSAVPGDYDNDGDIDFVIGWWLFAPLYQNDGAGHFTDVTASSGMVSPGKIHGGAFVDVDNDGDLDLAFANKHTDRLFINDGGGHFTEDAAARGVDIGDYHTTTMWADINNDGDIDLILGARTAQTRVFENDGTGHFTDVTLASGLNSSGAQYVCLGDIDNDGDLDLYDRSQGVHLNDGSGHFTNIAGTAGISASSDYAAAWIDANNDGYLDLAKKNELWINNGDLTFTKFADSGLGVVGDPYSVTFGDIDGDGDMDARASTKLLRNETNNGNYLIVRPVRPYGSPAHNAKVWLYQAGHLGEAGHLLGYREIIAATVRTSGSPLYAHFGLPHDATVDVRVRFLSGTVKELTGVARGQKITVVEPLPPHVEALDVFYNGQFADAADPAKMFLAVGEASWMALGGDDLHGNVTNYLNGITGTRVTFDTVVTFSVDAAAAFSYEATPEQSSNKTFTPFTPPTAPAYAVDNGTSKTVITITFTDGEIKNRWLKTIIDASQVSANGLNLDGELPSPLTLPSGDGTAGGNAEFIIGHRFGDVDGNYRCLLNDAVLVRNRVSGAVVVGISSAHDMDKNERVLLNDAILTRNAVSGIALPALP